MKNVSFREKIMLLVLVLCLAFYAYYRFFLTPILDKASTAKESIANYNSEVLRIKQAAVLNEKLKQQITELNTKYMENSKSLPQLEKEPEIAYQLKTIADVNGVTINGVNVSTPAEYSQAANGQNQQAAPQQNTVNGQQTVQNTNNGSEPKLYVVPVSITVKGSYTSILSFTASVESGTRFADLSTVSLNKDQDGAITAAVNANYYFITEASSTELKYDFNNGTYGKSDLFK